MREMNQFSNEKVDQGFDDALAFARATFLVQQYWCISFSQIKKQGTGNWKAIYIYIYIQNESVANLQLDNVSAGSTEWQEQLKSFWERFDNYCRNANQLDVKKRVIPCQDGRNEIDQESLHKIQNKEETPQL
ncbi:uncharacterized protein LOC104585284 isoform X2 [Brachypodium distachyon]|uniref:uncharacterized protein LOC104585284 isoform X2 n=1 Tax=Brachypodium distachyon TaxID=15368 RepID=UPI00071C790C|nr:uncharacterized protein LOC104585284 isoform X2 [Brachypodium distachyon]|eukprot:XP_014751470.1 uncharacterized protein LOC104585284 isoform X2 [Brachypodium distachyon]